MGADLAVEVAPEIDAAPEDRWWTNPRLATIAALAAGLLALGICIYQLSRPGALHGIDEYDDGFYLGTLMRLVNGTLPYKNFVYPQPPGLPILLFPLGLLGRVVGTRTLMGDIRIFTAFVAAANAVLAGLLLRRRGVAPALVAGSALALFPMAVTANKTLMLEPYLVCGCLVGAVVLFAGDDLASRRRLLVGGLILGFACTLKLWALMPATIAVLCCVPHWRRQVRPLVTGLVVGSVVPALPFVVLAPHNFFRDLVAIQFFRQDSPETTSAADRLAFVTGIRGLPGVSQDHTFAVVVAAIVAAVVLVAFLVPVRRMKLDWFVLGTATLAVAAMFVSPDFHPHYAYFAAAFTAILLGLSCGRLVRFGGSLASRGALRPKVEAGLSIAVIAAVVIGAVWGFGQARTNLRKNPGLLTIGELNPEVRALIPAGACTVSDEPALTLLANRFVPNRSSCPDIVDTFSTWIAYDPDTLPPSRGPYDPELVAAWQSWFAAADYAVLSASPFRIPWSQELVSWFNQNYRLISKGYGVQVYQFVGNREP